MTSQRRRLVAVCAVVIAVAAVVIAGRSWLAGVESPEDAAMKKPREAPVVRRPPGPGGGVSPDADD